MKFERSRLSLGLVIEAIALCLIASFRFINIESTATLLIFNLLFLSLTFQLNGTLTRKLGMLALGNVIGFFGIRLSIFSLLQGSRFLAKHSMFSTQFYIPFWISCGLYPSGPSVWLFFLIPKPYAQRWKLDCWIVGSFVLDFNFNYDSLPYQTLHFYINRFKNG